MHCTRERAALASMVALMMMAALGCNLEDGVAPPATCQEGQTRAQERCVMGRWVKGPDDMSALDMSADLAQPQDLGSPDQPDASPSSDMPDMPDRSDMLDMSDMPDGSDMTDMGASPLCPCASGRVCLAGRCARVTRVSHPRGLPQARFGAAVAAHGDWIAVGAPGDERTSLAGQVYMFRREGARWSHVQTINSSGLRPEGSFGASLAMNEHTLVVGSPYETQGAHARRQRAAAAPRRGCGHVAARGEPQGPGRRAR